MADGLFDPETGELTPRPPEKKDLVQLCRELNQRDCAYAIVGGYAMIQAGLPPTTGDIFFLKQLFAAEERTPPSKSPHCGNQALLMASPTLCNTSAPCRCLTPSTSPLSKAKSQAPFHRACSTAAHFDAPVEAGPFSFGYFL